MPASPTKKDACQTTKGGVRETRGIQNKKNQTDLYERPYLFRDE